MTTTTSATKVTNRIALEYCIKLIDMDNDWCDQYDVDDVVDKLTKMIEQIDKKNASPKKLTAQQTKNEEVKTELLTFLTDNAGKGFTVSDLLKSVPACEGDSNQHVSALMRALLLVGSVEKYTEKRRTYFRVVVGE